MQLKKYIPILDWLPRYKKSFLKGDISAGLTVGVMLVPQGMAYAMIAGLPPVYGLYAAIFPQIVYAIFGTSRQLAVGPVAMDSLLVAAGVSTIASVGSDEYIAIALMLALLMGAIQLLFGILRLGFLVDFLSKPVISGFTSAAALIIGFNQFKHLFGVDIERSSSFLKLAGDAVASLGEINTMSLVIGVAGIVVMKSVKKIHASIPGALVVVVLGILAVQFLGLDQSHQVKIIGEVPSGLPSFKIPEITFDLASKLLPMALTLGLIAFMEAVSVAKSLEAKHKGEYELDNNQEMIGLGLGNIVGSLFGSYPTTGGFGRSAVNDQSGANTNIAALISAGLMVLILLFLTPLFYYLPKAILGSIIIVAVFGLIDFKFPRYILKVNRQDFLIYLGTFLVTLFIGIKEGIFAGVIISLLTILYRNAQPHFAILGRFPDSKTYRNVERFDSVKQRSDVFILRYDSPLYFVNAANFLDEIKRELESRDEVKFFVLHCGSISYVDVSALEKLNDLIDYLESEKIEFAFSGMIGPVRDFLTKVGFVDKIGSHHFFIDLEAAVNCYDNCQDLSDQDNPRAIQSNQ
ncbi:solute carrier family 26 protein [Flavobacteriales bacterium]|nr:solute carrier family 26 protein [Flavobacteriales bacterium]